MGDMPLPRLGQRRHALAKTAPRETSMKRIKGTLRLYGGPPPNSAHLAGCRTARGAKQWQISGKSVANQWQVSGKAGGKPVTVRPGGKPGGKPVARKWQASGKPVAVRPVGKPVTHFQ